MDSVPYTRLLSNRCVHFVVLIPTVLKHERIREGFLTSLAKSKEKSTKRRFRAGARKHTKAVCGYVVEGADYEVTAQENATSSLSPKWGMVISKKVSLPCSDPHVEQGTETDFISLTAHALLPALLSVSMPAFSGPVVDFFTCLG